MTRVTAPLSPWTPERAERARRLWAKGISAAEIAAELGAVSRSAVISRMYRDKASTGRAAPAPPRAADPLSVRRGRRDINRASVRIPAPPDRWRVPPDAGEAGRVPVDLSAFAPLAGSAPRRWESRRHGECAWPVEMEGEEAVWSCCAPVQRLRSYCPAHMQRRRDPEPGPDEVALRQEADALVAWLQKRGG